MVSVDDGMQRVRPTAEQLYNLRAVNSCRLRTTAREYYCIRRANMFTYAPFRFGSRVGFGPWFELKCWTSGYPRNSRTKRGIP